MTAQKPVSEEQQGAGPREEQTTATLAAGPGSCGVTWAVKSQEAPEQSEDRIRMAHRSCSNEAACCPKNNRKRRNKPRNTSLGRQHSIKRHGPETEGQQGLDRACLKDWPVSPTCPPNDDEALPTMSPWNRTGLSASKQFGHSGHTNARQ